MYRSDLDVWVAIISSGRTANIPAMQTRVGPATWYVPPEEVQHYTDAGAASVVGCRARGQCIQRNDAMRDAFEIGVPIVQLDDDLKAIKRAMPDDRGIGYRVDFSFGSAIKLMRSRLDLTPYKLAGCLQTDNIQNAHPDDPLRYTVYVRSSFILIKPCPIQWDERLLLKIDYDYTCQHLAGYGGVVKNCDIMPTSPYATNSGGCQQIRNPVTMRRSVEYVSQKWPGVFRPNSKYVNEIIMRWKPEHFEQFAHLRVQDTDQVL